MNSIHFTIAMIAISSVIMMSDALFLTGLILLKLAVIKGAIIGGLIGAAAGRRGRRDVDNEAMKDMLVRASQQDDDDCAKKLICYANSLKNVRIPKEELALVELFGDNEIDLADSSVEFHLAAQIGKKVGVKQCEVVYARCLYTYKQLVEAMSQPIAGNLIQ